MKPRGFLYGVLVRWVGFGWGRGGEITTACSNAKISCYMYKKKSIYVNAFYCINDTVYAYFTMDIIMHICILYFINFNKHYIVHLHQWVNSLFFMCAHVKLERR